MKHLFIIAVLLFAVSGYSKGVPSPSIFFNLSEKILESAHQFVFPVTKVTSKVQPKRPEVKCNDKETVVSQQGLEVLWNPTLKLRREGMWIVSE